MSRIFINIYQKKTYIFHEFALLEQNENTACYVFRFNKPTKELTQTFALIEQRKLTNKDLLDKLQRDSDEMINLLDHSRS